MCSYFSSHDRYYFWWKCSSIILWSLWSTRIHTVMYNVLYTTQYIVIWVVWMIWLLESPLYAAYSIQPLWVKAMCRWAWRRQHGEASMLRVIRQLLKQQFNESFISSKILFSSLFLPLTSRTMRPNTTWSFVYFILLLLAMHFLSLL